MLRLVRLTTTYPGYLDGLYSRNPTLSSASYREQHRVVQGDFFGWADSWSHALAPLGYEAADILSNAETLQRRWAQEHDFVPGTTNALEDIAVAQLRAFRPEILWFDDHRAELLARIRAEVPSLRLVLGWAGSAIPKTEVWRDIDLILSCAPESVEHLRGRGFACEHLDHAFDPRVLEALPQGEKVRPAAFIGQILLRNEYHRVRGELLERLVATGELTIFSPTIPPGRKQGWKNQVRHLAAGVVNVLGETKAPGVEKLRALAEGRIDALPDRLLRALEPAVFGLGMYRVLRESRVVLNIHADSSPRFASNMRLFETTGVGACLLTDARENLSQLFEPGKEVVAYASADECADKMHWLVANPVAAERIARAGQERCLRDHTFAKRAVRLDKLIRERV